MEKKKKLAIISATPLTLQCFLTAHISLLRNKVEISLIFNNDLDRDIAPLEIPVKKIHAPIERKISLLRDFYALICLINILKKEKYDMVITVAPKAGLLGISAGYFSCTPIRLHIFQGEIWASATGFYRSILRLMDKITSSLSTNILAVSASEKQFLIKEKVSTSQKITVLGNGSIAGVDINRFFPDEVQRTETRTKIGIPSTATVIIFVGRMVVDKGITELFQAFSIAKGHLPNLYLLLVGSDEGNILEEKIFEYSHIKNFVKICKFTPNVERYLNASDFLCLPSYREGFPISILESAAVGIPAIGSDIYGISDAILDQETGLLVPPNNSQLLSEAIIRLALNKSLRNTLGSAAAARVREKFKEKEVVNRYASHILTILNNKPNNYLNGFVKRAIDFLLSVCALITLSLPMLMIYVIVCCCSEGGGIYFSKRLGRNNKPFYMAKFRTMKIGTPIVGSDKLTNPEIYFTPFGRILRKTSLDELPQLWNILKGDMSIIGPRPALFNQDKLIELRNISGLHILRPGLTGWAQINGRDLISDETKVQLDKEYMSYSSLFFDLKILLKTILYVFKGKGVTH